MHSFKDQLLEGIPETLPEYPAFDSAINRAPKRVAHLSKDELKLALKNALRYFSPSLHKTLAKEFLSELKERGHIYMYRYMPSYRLYARPIGEIPCKSKKAGAIIHMLLNNLDHAVAQHPYELVTYGGNGGVFQNWAQFRLTVKYLAELEEDQTLVLYSGHPMGVFPSNENAPRCVVTNGMMIPNFSDRETFNKLHALGVTQYGQMTAGSFMYIGPQGIVHGTTITVLNAGRLKSPGASSLKGKLFVSSGLGGMSGAQAKGGSITGAVTVIAEVNEKPLKTRHSQGWVNEVFSDLAPLMSRIKGAVSAGEAVSIAYHGNVVDLWERLDREGIIPDIGSDQTSLHNPFGGGYYPVGASFEEGEELLANDPVTFKELVYSSLKRHVAAVNRLTEKGMYFFDYGNAFLLEASRAGADVFKTDGSFKFPSYVQDIIGPLCFDYGFGPFRWVCTSADEKDLDTTDEIACAVIESMIQESPHVKSQLQDNLLWIKEAKGNSLVVGSQARILYANSEGRIRIAKALNEAVREGRIKAPVVIGRDHHDVSGTDSPYRETSNIYDGSQWTADMAVQNVIGDSFRGATWVSLHNGGGVGWGEVINGGFGLVLDGSKDAESKAETMLFWDVNNGIARRSWARNEGALEAIKIELLRTKKLKITIPSICNESLLNEVIS